MARPSRILVIWLLGLVAATMMSSINAGHICEGEADILLVVDSSGSIGSTNYGLAKDFLAQITTFFKVGPNKVQFAALVFSSDYSNVFGFQKYSNNPQVAQAIGQLPYYGMLTYTGAALKSAREYSFTPANGARSNVAKIAIVITDGKSTDYQDTSTQAFLLKQSGVTVIAIGVGSGIDHDELEEIASRPNLVILSGNFSALSTIRNEVETKVCDEQNNQYTGACFKADTSCVGKPDGDYPACAPECEDGYYYSCVAGFRYQRPCGLATYIDDYNNPYQARMVYDAGTGTCELECDECPRDPQDHKVIVDPWNPPIGKSHNPCISSSSSCQGRPNGNYPMCYPDCQNGFFYTCSNDETYKMPCALGWYVDSSNTYFTARMVYDNDTDTCVLQDDSCPRNPEDYSTTTTTVDPDGTGTDDTPNDCDAKADILFLMDSSGSIGSNNYLIQQFFLADLTTFFVLGSNAVQFSAVVFSTDAFTVFGFDTYDQNQNIRDAILNTHYYQGLTNTHKALSIARVFSFTSSNGARQNVGKVVVVVTDGVSTDPVATYSQAAALKASGVTVICVGVGAHVDQTELETMASSPAHVFTVQDFSVLAAIRNELITVACDSGEIFDTCVDGSCLGRADGDYAACDPECQDGYYYSCQNGFAFKRECPLDWYADSFGDQFLARLVYNPNTNSCEREVDSCLRDPVDHEVSPDPWVPPDGSTNNDAPCIGVQESCSGLADGDYPMCSPECQSGYYFSCVADEATERPCPFGTYIDSKGKAFQALMVYSPLLGYCNLTSEFCPRTVVNPGPTTPPTSPPEPPTCSSKGDLLFIVDSSASIGSNNYDALTAFLATMITYLDIGPNDFQISAIVFSTDTTLEFKFGQYTTEAQIFQALLNLPYKHGLTNTALALQQARETAFDPNCGARSNVPKVVVIVTDGVSKNPQATELEADRLKRSGVTSIVVSIGGFVRWTELEALASSPDLIFTVNDFDVLDAIKADVIQSTCESTEIGCLTDESSCATKADGDYSICGQKCAAGYYIQCSNQNGYERFCSLGIYFHGLDLYYARLVFDPITKVCQETSSYCPRDPWDYAMNAGD